MTREEFLSTLRKTLQGKVSSDKMQENLNYYHDYIIEEVQKGKSEEEIFRMLGDPCLLAKTIIAADDAGKHQKDSVYETEDTGDATEKGRSFGREKVYAAGAGKWWKKLLVVLAVVMLILLIVAVVSGVIRILAPLVLPVIIIMIVVRIFKRR